MENKINWRALRKKENKTKEEQLLLDLKDSLVDICEALVANSKSHKSDKETIDEIRTILGEVSYKL